MMYVFLFVIACCILDSCVKASAKKNNTGFNSSKAEELKAWSQMLKDGNITQEEFNEKKRELM